MPNNVIQKVYNGWNEYLVGGSSTEWAEVVYLTQAEYDALPSSKLTDGKIYKIKTTGVVPGGSADASDVEYDNTTSGLTATNVQDAINEVNSKVSSGTMIERGDMVFCNFNGKTETDKYIKSVYHSSTGSTSAYYTISVYNNLNIEYTWTDPTGIFPWTTSDRLVTYKTFVFYHRYTNWGINSKITKINLNDYTTQSIGNWTFWSSSDSFEISGVKFEWDYMYCKTNATNFNYTKAPLSDITNVEAITQTEYDNVQNYINSVNWLFYAQDGDDYVATDINGTEVKRYVWVGTIHWIAGWKLYRNVWDVSYAIATI